MLESSSCSHYSCVLSFICFVLSSYINEFHNDRAAFYLICALLVCISLQQLVFLYLDEFAMMMWVSEHKNVNAGNLLVSSMPFL